MGVIRAKDAFITDLFANSWQFEGTWDNDACTLTFTKTGASTYGTLLYIGVKEA